MQQVDDRPAHAGFNQVLGREKILERNSTYNNTHNGGTEAVELVDNAAIPNETTAAIDGAAPNPKLQEVDVPAGEVIDVNKPIDYHSYVAGAADISCAFLGCCSGRSFLYHVSNSPLLPQFAQLTTSFHCTVTLSFWYIWIYTAHTHTSNVVLQHTQASLDHWCNSKSEHCSRSVSHITLLAHS